MKKKLLFFSTRFKMEVENMTDTQWLDYCRAIVTDQKHVREPKPIGIVPTIPRIRGWCFTWNNYTEDDWEYIKTLKCQYLVVGKEEAPTTGTPHLQGYIYYKDAKTRSAVSKDLRSKAHLIEAKGNANQNFIYCTKSGDFLEKGIRPKELNNKGGQNQRLTELRSRIAQGTPVREILLDDPMAYHQYGRTMNAMEDATLRDKKRDFMTQGYWIFGSTDVGKSHYARYTIADGLSLYEHTLEDNGWWDPYEGEDVVIFDDFRGQVKYGELLKLVDKWPHKVKRRGRAPAPFVSKILIITCSMSPEELFSNLAAEDKLSQLYRRFKILYKSSRDDIVEILHNL